MAEDTTPDTILLRDIRELPQKLPEQIVNKLSGGPGGGVFPGGAPAPADSGKPSAAGAKVRAGESLGFALGRFVPEIGQLAGVSRDIRNVMDAWKNLIGTKESVPPSAGPPSLSALAGEKLQLQKTQQTP